MCVCVVVVVVCVCEQLCVGFGDKSNLDEFLVNTAMLETSQFDISPLNFVIANMWLTSVTLDTPQFERPPSKFEKANE